LRLRTATRYDAEAGSPIGRKLKTNVQVAAGPPGWQVSVSLAGMLVSTLGRPGIAVVVGLGLAELVGTAVRVAVALGAGRVVDGVGEDVAVAGGGVPVVVGEPCSPGVPVGVAVPKGGEAVAVKLACVAIVGWVVGCGVPVGMTGAAVAVKSGVDVGLGSTGGAVAVLTGDGVAPPAAQIVRPSSVSQPSDASALLMALFSASTASKPLDPLPPAQADRAHQSARSHIHRAAARKGVISIRRLIVRCMTLSRTFRTAWP
jgi:hypothetical protein